MIDGTSGGVMIDGASGGVMIDGTSGGVMIAASIFASSSAEMTFSLLMVSTVGD